MEFPPDLILSNGRVVTVDPDFSVAEALAVYDGKIVAVGGSVKVEALAGARTATVDLKGRCVLPGQLDLSRFCALADGPPADIIRAKGVLHAVGSAARMIFQRVGERWSIEPGLPCDEHEDRRTELVSVGQRIDRDRLLAGFGTCMA